MKAPFQMGFNVNFPDLPKGLLENLMIASKRASVERIAIVGGAIRDMLISKRLNEKIAKFHDLDLLIEGSTENFAYEIQKLLGDQHVQIIQVSSSYQTVELNINGISVDIARAREEEYQSPGDNPKVFPSSLEKDLKRRDFTINSIAFDLHQKEIIDPYKGIDAISNRKLQLLHPKSISDDPTRIIRAARYSARLGFDLESDSVKQIQATIKSWPWSWNKKEAPEKAPSALGSRLRMEMDLLLESEYWMQAMSNLYKWGFFNLIDASLEENKNWEQKLKRAFKLNVNPLTALLAGCENYKRIARRLQLPQKEQKLLIESHEIIGRLNKLDLKKETISWGPSEWTKEIEQANWTISAIKIAISLGIPLWKPLFQWWKKWRLTASHITAKELIKRGWEEGPELGNELQRLREMELKKLSRSKKDPSKS